MSEGKNQPNRIESWILQDDEKPYVYSLLTLCYQTLRVAKEASRLEMTAISVVM